MQQQTKNPQQKTVKLPNGERISVKVPPAPDRNIRNFTIAKCRFNIPISSLEENIDAGRWPNPEILTQTPGSVTLPKEEIWTGSREIWRNILREEQKTATTKRVEKLRAIRTTQAVLRKIKAEEWASLKQIFSVQRHFSA